MHRGSIASWDARIFEDVASKLQALMKDANSLLDFHYAVGGLASYQGSRRPVTILCLLSFLLALLSVLKRWFPVFANLLWMFSWFHKFRVADTVKLMFAEHFCSGFSNQLF
ncbi:hypothetical protein COCNU_02G019160 [Cocos nucifera]|uniref:Uncharacterized protein n=1 Tax=Cocos nucifera TaxID=13894 RepID=A0A8K0I1X6_COCNU|nr:hypothetical protein COCNU_02G019160 [Cocos nucifera]